MISTPFFSALRLLLVCAVLVLFSGCEGGTYKQTTSWGGKTTVKTNDPQVLEAQRRQQAYRDALNSGERRRADEVIHVAFVNPTSKQVREEQNLEDIHQGLMNALDRTALIEVFNIDVPPSYGSVMASDYQLSTLVQRAQSKGYHADVYVLATLRADDVYGKDEAGKLKSVKGLVCSASLSSAYVFNEYQTRASGTIFQNVEVVDTLAARIAEIVMQNIAPQLPSHEGMPGF